MNKILLVEDDLRVSELIKRGLEESSFLVFTAYDGFMGKKLLESNDFDLMITDIILPKLDGIELCKEARLLKPNMPIIMLTALGTTDDKIEGFDAGADDYLVKPFDFRELHVRIKVLINRGIGSSTRERTIYRYADLELNDETKSVIRDGKEIKLTPKEFNLLKFMIQNPERVLSRVEIADKVWDTHFDTGTNFIDVYINYLRKKIDRDFRLKLIHTKPGMGFIFKSEV